MAISKNWLVLFVLCVCAIATILFIVLNYDANNNSAVATRYFTNITVDGHTFKVINDSSDIPYRKNNIKDPSNYSGYVHRPAGGKWPYSDNGSLDSVRLYTWSDMDGLLICWDVGISGDKVVRVYANLMDVGVGDYKQNNESLFIPALGVNVTGNNAHDIFEQYGDIYKNRSHLYDFKFSRINGGFVEWQHSVFRRIGIDSLGENPWYALEPGYLYDDISNAYHENSSRNVTAWGYYVNDSSYFSQFHSRPVKAFYVSYYTFEGSYPWGEIQIFLNFSK